MCAELQESAAEMCCALLERQGPTNGRCSSCGLAAPEGVACVPSYMRGGEARRMGVAVAVAWQHREGVACVPSYRRAQQKCAAHFSRGRARRMGVAVAVAWQHRRVLHVCRAT